MSCAKYIIENYLSEKAGSYSNNVEKEVTNSIDQGLDKTLANILKHTEKSALNADLLAPFKSKKNENTLKFRLSESLRNKIISERSLHPMTSFSNVFGNGNNPQPKGTPIAQQYQNAKTGFKNFMQNKVNPLAQKVAKGVSQGAKNVGSTVKSEVSRTYNMYSDAFKEKARQKQQQQNAKSQPTAMTPPVQQPSAPIQNSQQQPNTMKERIKQHHQKKADLKRSVNAQQQQGSEPNPNVQQPQSEPSNKTPGKIRQAMDKWATNRAEMNDAKNVHKEKQRQQQIDNMKQYGVKSDKDVAKQQFQAQKQQQKLNDIRQYGSGIGGWARKTFGQDGADNRRRNEIDKMRRGMELNMVKNMSYAVEPRNFKKSFAGYKGVSPMLQDFKRLYGYGNQSISY